MTASAKSFASSSLDATLVKSYATDFAGSKAFGMPLASRSRTRPALGDSADKDRNALLCRLNSYLAPKEKEGAA